MAAMARRALVVLIVTLGVWAAGSCSSSKLGLIRTSDTSDGATDRVAGHSDGASDGATADGTAVDGTTADRTTADAAVEARTAADEAAPCTGLPLGAPAPTGACPDTTPAGCGLDGTCDGAGGCHRYAAGTVCAAPTCLDSATSQSAAVCDGRGICVAGSLQICSPYTCVGGACYADDCKFQPEDCLQPPNRDASSG
jgi:hypothetical protein